MLIWKEINLSFPRSDQQEIDATSPVIQLQVTKRNLCQGLYIPICFLPSHGVFINMHRFRIHLYLFLSGSFIPRADYVLMAP